MMKKHLTRCLGCGMAGLFCALFCWHGGSNEAMAACNAPPDTEYELVAWIDGPSLVCVNQDATFSVFASGPIDSYTWATQGGSPASGEDYEFTTKWSSPGYNNVSVNIVGVDWDENHDCKAEDDTNVTVVAVDSIDYFGKGVATPHFVPAGTPVTFTAIPTPGNLWPDGKPVWDDSSIGATAIRTFNLPGDYEITAECGNTVTEKVTVLKVDFIEASCPKANNTPQQFEGHKTDFGDPCATNDPGQALAIFQKDARDASLVVQDFDVTLNAHVLPASVTADQLNESWAKVQGPTSGNLNRTDTFEVKYQNPTKGGVYKFEFNLGLPGCAKSGANVELPLGGPDVTAYYLSEEQRYDTWLTTMKTRVHTVSSDDFVRGSLILAYFTKTVANMNHKNQTFEAGQSPCKVYCPGTVTISDYCSVPKMTIHISSQCSMPIRGNPSKSPDFICLAI